MKTTDDFIFDPTTEVDSDGWQSIYTYNTLQRLMKEYAAEQMRRVYEECESNSLITIEGLEDMIKNLQ